MNDVRPHRTTRSLARTGAQMQKARELRHAPTDTEQAAWGLLRSMKFTGLKFRRQQPVGPYLVDFYCAQRRLIVELDGSVHGQASQARSDSRRDAHLKKMGYVVLRFSNRIVQEAPELFVQKKLGRRTVATGGIWIRRPDMDPLTRLAPADEGAGCDPPSPPRGRGQRNAEIERPTNVETPDSTPLGSNIPSGPLPTGSTRG